MQRQSDLLQVVLALRTACCLTRLLNGRQQQGDQNCDNRNHDEQFDQRKAWREPAGHTISESQLFHGRFPLKKQKNPDNNQEITPAIIKMKTEIECLL